MARFSDDKSDFNPYAPPSDVSDRDDAEDADEVQILAMRGTRWGARFLDQLLLVGAAMPAILVYATSAGKDAGLAILLGLFAFALACYQWYLISTTGQTLAKKWLKIKIVKMDGSSVDFISGVLLREWVVLGASAIPSVGNLVGFSTTYVGGMNRPEDIIKAVVSDSIDVAIVWGPIAGYYTKQLAADLVLRPVETDSVSGIPFAYSIGMATRRADRAFRDSLQGFIDAKGTEIRAILDQFGIPLLPIPADTGRNGPAGPAR